jgi:GxxExxY protein
MTRGDLMHERLTHSVIGAFFDVYNTLGFGFLEYLYVLALERELLTRGHRVGREVWVSVLYKGDELGKQRLDMVIDETLMVETKSMHDLPKAATRQLYNYLRATGLEVGLLLHFGPEPRFYRVICRNSQRSKKKIPSGASVPSAACV